MGKQNRSWIPPEDDEIIDQEKPAAKTVWMPPAQDEVVEEPVKKKEPAGAASVTPAVKDGVPSGANTAQVSPEQQRDLANLKLDEPRPVPKGSLESDLKNKALEVAQTFRTSRQALDTPAEALINTVKSGIADQIPKEYYAQRLRMSKGSFGDLFDPRSNLNAFGDKLPAGISRDEFARWSNQNRDKVLGKSYDERAQAFLTEKLGTDGYERMKVAFQQENQQERSGFEEEVQQQNKEAAQRTAGVVQNLKDVDGAASFLNFAGNMLGQALYRAPTSILSGGVGSIVSESSAVYDRQIDLIAEKEGISRQEVIKRGLDKPAEGQALAVLAGELDALSSVNLIGLFRKAAGKELTKNLVKEFAKGFVKGGVPEALTEAAQGEIEEFAAAKGAEVDYSPDAWRIATGAAGGLIGGGLIGGASAVKLTPDQEAKSTAQVIQEEVKNPDIDTAAETIQAKVEQSGDAGVYTFTPPSTDEETQAAPVATPPQEGEVSEDQTQEALPVQEETKTVTPDDSQDQSGLQSNQREGQEPIQADTEQSGGGEASQAGGILQKEEEITGPESGVYSYGQPKEIPDIDVDQKSGDVVPRQPSNIALGTAADVEGIKQTLINAGKITEDEKGNVTVKQNSGYPSQLYEDLYKLSGDRTEALNMYLRIKDDAGEFKKKFGDWENQIMKDFGRAGLEYTIKLGKPQKAPPSSYTWTTTDDNGNMVIRFNPKKVRREENFTEVKQEYKKTVYKDDSPEYQKLYDQVVNKLRDLKLHLIHLELIKKQKGAVTIEDKIKSLQEIERLNGIELAKDYYGEPMIFMHGGKEGIKQFLKPGDPGYKRSDKFTGSAGIYLSRSPELARQYARFTEKDTPGGDRDLYYTFLRTKNPYYTTDPRAQADFKLKNSMTITTEDVQQLKDLGYDAIIWDDEKMPKREVIVFDPGQIEIIGSHKGGLRNEQQAATIQGQQEQSDMDSGSQEGQQPASVTSEQQQEQRSERVRGEPPATPEAAQTQQPSSPRTLKIAQRILDSDASEAIKRGVREKGADYIPKRLDVTDQEANDLLDLYGNDKAESVIRDTKNDLTQDTRTAMAARLYERYKGEADAATDSQQKSSLYNKAVDIALFGANQAKEAGRAVNANKIWKAITSDEDLMVLALEKENQATAQKLIEPIQQQVMQSKEQFDEQVRRMVEQKVQETVEERVKRAKLITKEQKQKISDAFDSLKVKDVGDTANDVIRVLGAAVWNGSMEAVKRAVLTGADVANAVQAGLDYIRDNYKGTFDENEYRDIVSRGITPLISVSKPISSDNIDADAVTTPRLKGKKKKQFIEQIVDEYNKKGQITDDRFEQIYAKQLGFKEFSDEDRARIRDLAKVISETEKFAEVVKSSSGADLRQNIAKYKTLLDQARKANKELQEFARKPSNVWDTLITIMQGNLLTPLSIVTNVYSNAALQPLRFLSTGVGSLVDRSISGLAKMDLMSRSYKDPTIDLVAVQKGFAPGIWDGTIEGWKQLKEGQLTSDKDLREIQSGFDPVAAVKRWSDEDRELSQKINDAIEGTLGFPAEGMFRLLNFGDKPFRRAAELGRAMEIADRKKLTGDEKIKFLMFPDEASAAEIDKAGKQATFQQETELSKKVQKYITDFLNLAQSVPYIGGPIKILLKSQIPYVKTPLNIVIETFDYALPPITFGRGVYSILKGNRRAGAVLIGKAVVGAIIMTVARQLFQMGLLSWEDDKDKKGRNIQYDSVPPASMNVDALARGLTGQGWEIKDDDTWIAYKKMGVAGILFNNYTNNYFRSLKDEEQMPGFMEEMVTSAPRVLSSSLEQSFLKGTNSFLNALQDQGGYETQQWAIETAGAISSIVLPNTIATISKSSDEYIRDTYNRDFTDRLAATFKAKVFMGGQLPPKVNLWGEKVTGNPEGRNKYAYYLFDPTKFKNVDTDSYKWKLYEAWRGDNFNPEWLPAQPTRSLKVRGINMKLSPKEFELFSTFIGQERARAVQGYINSGWRYQKPEQRIERLKELYAEGRERGKQKFLMQTGWGVMTPKKLEAINENR